MFEKHEKWFILAIIAAAIWYFYRKGMTQKSTSDFASAYADLFSRPSQPIDTTMIPASGSLVNPTTEQILPAEASYTPPFNAAQPSTVPISQRVSSGVYTWYPAPPTLRRAPLDSSYV